MGWGIGTGAGGRDIGYSVPAECDLPTCHEEIARGLAYLCGEIGGGEHGCGLYFCEDHLKYRKPRYTDQTYQFCPRCYAYKWPSYQPKPDILKWVIWKLYEDSWERWRSENQGDVSDLAKRVSEASPELVISAIKEYEMEDGFNPPGPPNPKAEKEKT